jgi:hypothetical protein
MKILRRMGHTRNGGGIPGSSLLLRFLSGEEMEGICAALSLGHSLEEGVGFFASQKWNISLTEHGVDKITSDCLSYISERPHFFACPHRSAQWPIGKSWRAVHNEWARSIKFASSNGSSINAAPFDFMLSLGNQERRAKSFLSTAVRSASSR